MTADHLLLERIESALSGLLPAISKMEGGRAVEAAAYSLTAGGKRIRPTLLLRTAAMFDIEETVAMPFAAALEMIHTYSLIHDDLPAMDDDDTRRGRPSNHKAFGEANAILAGDGLLNLAYETMLAAIRDNPNEKRIEAASIIGRAAGFHGMIGGQCLDLEEERPHDPEQALRLIQQKKTGALISAAVLAGAALGGASDDVREALLLFSDNLGLAFQIKDDLLDVQSTSKKLGKTVGKDQRDDKLTFVTWYGEAKAERFFSETMQRAKEGLERAAKAGLDVTDLASIWHYLEQRDY